MVGQGDIDEISVEILDPPRVHLEALGDVDGGSRIGEFVAEASLRGGRPGGMDPIAADQRDEPFCHGSGDEFGSGGEEMRAACGRQVFDDPNRSVANPAAGGRFQEGELRRS